MRTLIDCDGVLANFTKMAQKLIIDEFGIDVRVTDGKNWDMFDYQEVFEIKDKIWKIITQTKGLFRDLEKFEYTDELISKLREISHEVVCVTSIISGGYYADERINWLIEELDFSRDDIILARKKHLVEGDIFIDDKPLNVIQWADRWHEQWGIPVLWQAPDRGFNTPNCDNRILVTGNVNELISYIREEKYLDIRY